MKIKPAHNHRSYIYLLFTIKNGFLAPPLRGKIKINFPSSQSALRNRVSSGILRSINDLSGETRFVGVTVNCQLRKPIRGKIIWWVLLSFY